MFYFLIKSTRPRQYIKNLIIFAALIFSQNMFNYALLIKTIYAFCIFCLLSGSVYIINDLCDIEEDRMFLRTSARPIPSGQLTLTHATIAAILLSSASLWLAYVLDCRLGWVAVCYFALAVSYSLFLKRIMVVNMIIVSLGFVLRAIAGSVVIHVNPSFWLFVCTLFLALFLAACKRRTKEYIFITHGVRNVMSKTKSSIRFFDKIILITVAASILSYAFYTTSEMTVSRLQTSNLKFTVFFVIFGILRYLYLVYQKKSREMPEEILLTDKPLLLNIILWIMTTIFVIYK